MAYSHAILTIEPRYNDKAEDFAQVLRERGQTCDVLGHNEGIHKKLDYAKEKGYDFVHVINQLEYEINSMNVRSEKGTKVIGTVHIVDFLHRLACGKYN